MIVLIVFGLCMTAIMIAANRADKMRVRRRTANILRDQLVREIAEVQTLAITSLKASPQYMQRVNELLDRATDIVRKTNVDSADSLQNLHGGIALVSQAGAIVAGASAR
jgi:hypothetical protein